MDGLLGGLESGEVQDGLDPPIDEQTMDQRPVCHRADDELNARDGFAMAVVERVEDDRLVAGRLQESGRLGADVASATGDQDAHVTGQVAGRLSPSSGSSGWMDWVAPVDGRGRPRRCGRSPAAPADRTDVVLRPAATTVGWVTVVGRVTVG